MIAGRNGSGKSTLLRVLSTAISPDRGTARIHGFDVTRSRDEVREEVSYLGHHLGLYESLTAMENLQVRARHLGLDASRTKILDLLGRVDLAERADDPVSGFSAGMRKRVAIAGLILKPSRVVMLDEPYGQLDPPGFRLVDSLLQSLRTEGVTVLVATHQLARASAFFDGGIVLDEGRLTWSGEASELPLRGGLDSGMADGN